MLTVILDYSGTFILSLIIGVVFIQGVILMKPTRVFLETEAIVAAGNQVAGAILISGTLLCTILSKVL